MKQYLSKLSLISEPNKYYKIYCDLINRNYYISKNFKSKLDYKENHHIYPSCICSDIEKKDKENIVSLTAKEHFIAHRLLTKFILDKTLLDKMHFAVFCMTRNDNKQQRYSINSRTYETLKKNISAIRLGKEPSNKGKSMSENQKEKLRKPKSEECKRKISESKKGKKITPEQSKEKSLRSLGKGNNFYGKNHTIETRKHLSEIKTGSKLSFRTEEHKKNLSKALKGRKISDLEKEKRKNTQLRGEDHQFFGGLPDHMFIVCHYCEKRISKSMHTRWHGEKCKFKNHTDQT